MLLVVILCHEMFADQFKEMTSQVNFVRKNWSKEAIFSSFFSALSVRESFCLNIVLIQNMVYFI